MKGLKENALTYITIMLLIVTSLLLGLTIRNSKKVNGEYKIELEDGTIHTIKCDSVLRRKNYILLYDDMNIVKLDNVKVIE